jgi:hypothetical protein
LQSDLGGKGADLLVRVHRLDDGERGGLPIIAFGTHDRDLLCRGVRLPLGGDGLILSYAAPS